MVHSYFRHIHQPECSCELIDPFAEQDLGAHVRNTRRHEPYILGTSLIPLQLHIIGHDDMCEHGFQFIRSEEATGARVATVPEGEEVWGRGHYIDLSAHILLLRLVDETERVEDIGVPVKFSVGVR